MVRWFCYRAIWSQIFQESGCLTALMPEACERAAGRRPRKQLPSDGSELLLAGSWAPQRHCWIAALIFVQITAVDSQTCTYTRDILGNTIFPRVWIEHSDVLASPAPLSCNPETIPSDNRLHAFPGQRYAKSTHVKMCLVVLRLVPSIRAG